MYKQAALLVCIALAVCLTGTKLWAQPKIDAPPIRVVLRGFAKMPQQTEFVDALLKLCLASKRLPAGSVAVPSAQVLAALPLIEEETLFDGYWAATFTTKTSVQPDLAGNCKMMLLRTYSASVDKSCSHSISAGTAGQEADIAKGQLPTIDITRQKRDPEDNLPAKYRCQPLQKEAATPTNGLPIVKTAQGAPCIWSNDLLNRALELKGRAEMMDKRPQSIGTCVHPKWQLYPTNTWSGSNRNVVLKTFNTLRSLGDTDMADAMPALYAANHDAYIFEEGQPVAAARFTEAAVRTFVSQPAWVPIGKP